jgi:hypothetical protein
VTDRPPKPPSPQERLAQGVETLVGIMERRERGRERVGHDSGDLRKPLWTLHALRLDPDGMREFARRVPPEFWALEDAVAVVACPCGETPAAVPGTSKTCECGRAYLYDGQIVRVAFSPLDQPEQEPAPA